MNSHLTLAGHWVRCNAVLRACPRLFHLAGTSPAEANLLPPEFLEALFEALDPPTKVDMFGKEWRDADGNLHRDHDLPAHIGDDGGRFWYQQDMLHRAGDKPAVVYPDGEQHWLYEDAYAREDGKPTIVYPDGRVSYERS